MQFIGLKMSRINHQSNSTITTTVVEEPINTTIAVQHLTLSPELSREPRVRWSADTIDNEFLGRYKSKCCCIYKKPKKWNESSDSDSDSDCETEHCRGHVEQRFHPLGGGDGGK
ncbi:Protein phosphatase inhibitor containing protein [Brugia malayi]|uniref:E3 ubiquitin-protein ligase PPP1R11 n=1 Tax=Brugia malayi TaxID=6279 RepID=A0A0K0JXU8_BRUMA|nr:Protein phosphatase inhibitor containing protein [Brugia malayi]CDP92469.1 Bm9028 [Brugia malayi]VIO88215.1 Protein phosphatase inhibitor containing protein [Brugia malayi]